MWVDWLRISLATLLAFYVFLFIFLRKLNGWYYALKVGKKRSSLPPGDMGWPLLGNTLFFIRAFSFTGPDSLINTFVSKYEGSGIYKTHLLGRPSIMVCVPDMCWQVLTDDRHFKLGYPKSTMELAPSRRMGAVSTAEHRHFRRLTIAPIIGHNALAMYLERIEEIMITSLEEMASMKHPFELLKQMKKVTFKVIIRVFMGSDNPSNLVNQIGTLFNDMFNGIFSLAINVPGFTFHKALKARKTLAGMIDAVVEERRKILKRGSVEGKKDLVDILLEVEDESGEKLNNEDIVDLLLGFLVAGHESSATSLMWAIIYLTEHPQIMKKAKEEQEDIIKARPPTQKQLNIKEVKQMVYLAKVIDETLRLANIAGTTFREATSDVYINGYLIPKGWRVLIWSRAVHMDPQNFINPQEFNPSRWDDYNGKAGTFLPFGAGSRLCPGRDLAKLEMSIFLHYFLLNYKLERVNPKCGVAFLPVPKPKDECLARVIKV